MAFGFPDKRACGARAMYVRSARSAIASVGGIGSLPRGPATAASIAGALTLRALRPGIVAHAALLACAVYAGQVCANELAHADDPDPQRIVIDELAGVWLAFLGIRMTTARCLIGTGLFRALDKLKPGPIGLVDRMDSRWSVMGDDLVAGALANLVLRAWIAGVDSAR